MAWLITPEQTLAAARQAGVADRALRRRGVAVVTFNRAIVERMEELCDLQDATWIGPQHHPYAAADVVKQGEYKGLTVTLVVPPMGASPLACVVEDLAACGVKGVFLVCAAWSLGPPVKFGDLIVPSFSTGPDGTSIHYGNTSGRVEADPAIVRSLTEACRKLKLNFHVGGNASCEAPYRITPEMVTSFRERGCLSMENGEASTLLAATRTLGIAGGVIFQPYIDLLQGWDPKALGELYKRTCRYQADIVLDACLQLKEQEILGNSSTARTKFSYF